MGAEAIDSLESIVQSFAGRLSEARESLVCGIDTVYTMYHKLTHSKTICLHK